MPDGVNQIERRGALMEDLRAYLSGFVGRRVHYVPNPGNAGDSVMSAATFQALEALGIPYTVPHLGRFDPKGKVILYGGGGNLYERGRYSHRVLHALHREAEHLTILPHTVKDVDDLLDAFGGNVTVICREQPSYDYVAGRGGRYRTLLMHDLAFSLDVPALMRDGAGYNPWVTLARAAADKVLRRTGYPAPEDLMRAMRPPALPPGLAERRSGTINVFRLDGEATGIAIPPDNADLSRIFMYGVSPKPVAYHSARSLMAMLDRFDEVRTNRLHVGISAALLGKRVLLHANNYYKIRAIYEYSLRDRYPNVIWMGEGA
ncbi:polysaccharide pyruvyl transferase family protein [Roseomonas sp. CCTCC AB2023176]|uniref:polysaccharide pyruvyl transferase family protein n=1 Tax=Roseomonas sp. CCTCC AB2023176 TaxID=3342640 RepID=UPI0035E0885F